MNLKYLQIVILLSRKLRLEHLPGVPPGLALLCEYSVSEKGEEYLASKSKPKI